MEIALIFAAVAVAYAPAWHAGFIWDDDGYVTRPALRSLHGLWRIWFEVGATDQYYPLLHSAFWVEHRLWGDSPLGYHLLNVAEHAGAAGLLVLVLRRLAIPGAFLAGLVFALHPVAVESVAWVAEQKNTLSTVFYLLAALSYLGWREKSGPGKTGAYALASLFFVCALLSKTVTATLPAALLVVIWWRQGRLSRKGDVLPLAPWMVVGAGAGLFSAWVENHVIGAHGAAFALTFLQRTLLAGRVVWFYAAKVIWPADLIFIYPRWAIAGTDLAAWLFPLAALALLAGLFGVARRTRAPLAGALFFIGTLFPVLGFFNVYPFIYSYVADHWQYMACLGVIVPVCAGLTLSTRRQPRWLRGSGLVLLLGLLGGLTWRQSGMYNDMETFYRTTIARNPSCWMAENNLGNLLRDRGDAAGAMRFYEAALAVDPRLPEVQNNFGAALADGGRFSEAIGHYRRALAIAPHYAIARHNLEVALQETAEQAMAEYDLGVTLSSSGQAREAIRHYEAALRLKPDYAEAENNLGAAWAVLGHPAEAIRHYESALRLRPDYAAARYNLELARKAAGN